MRLTFISLILCTIPCKLFSQDFEVPKNFSLKKAEDFAALENDVIRCFNWLMDTPISEQTAKRKEVNAFLLQWLSGSPNVHIEIKPEIVTFMSTSPDLLMIFMGGWTRYSLETKDFNNKIDGNLHGLESVIEFYTKNKTSIQKDKHVEKYIKMKEKGTLKDYVRKNA